jgi:hypothetical protein
MRRRKRGSAYQVDGAIARVDLAVDLALTLIPNPSPPPREHGLDAQQVFHLTRLEDPALWVDQRNALAAELEPASEIGGIEHPALQSSKPVHVVESRLT